MQEIETDFEIIRNKLKTIRRLKNLTQEEFAKSIGVTRSVLGQMEIGKNNPTVSMIQAVVSKYSIDANLILSESIAVEDLEELIDRQKPTNHTAYEVNEPAVPYGKQKPIPLIPFDALASPGRGELGFMENQAESFYIVPEFAKADYLIRVKGSSMFPKFYPGEIIACQRLEAKSFVQWNHPHVLDTTQGLIVKNIMPGKDDEHWIMNSENKDYPDFEIHKSEVYSRSRVLGSIRLY